MKGARPHPGRISRAAMVSVLCLFGPGCFHWNNPFRVERALADMRETDLLGEGMFYLSGEWEFIGGTLLSESGGRLPESREAIELAAVPEFFTDRLSSPPCATYRLRVRLPARLYGAELAFYIPFAENAYRLYLNDRLLGTLGSPACSAERSVPERRVGNFPFTVPADPDGKAYVDVLVTMEISGHERGRAGPVGGIALGTSRYVSDTIKKESTYEALLAGGLGLIGLYHLGIFLTRGRGRRERRSALLGLLCLIVALRTAFLGQGILLEIAAVPYAVSGAAGFATYHLGVLVSALYMLDLFPDFPRIIGRIVAFVSASLFCLMLIFGLNLTWSLINFFHGIMVLLCAGIAYGVVVGLWKRRRGMTLISLGLIFMVVAGLVDVIDSELFLQIPDVLSLGLLCFVVTHSIQLYRDLSKSFQDVENLSAKLERKNLELRRLAQVKDEFMTNVSHELRTPLTTIYASSELLEQARDLNDVRRYRQALHEAAETLISYVDDLMLITDVESNPSLISSEFDLAEVLREIDFDALGARERGVQSRVTVHGNLPVRADRRLLSHAIEHLAKNAVQYNRRGGEVELQGERINGRIIVVVSDSGIGIEPGAHRRIFQKFTRLQPDESAGVGVGLFLARRIVELHGGRISVDSEPGRGSLFKIELPARETG